MVQRSDGGQVETTGSKYSFLWEGAHPPNHIHKKHTGNNERQRITFGEDGTCARRSTYLININNI